MNVAGVFLAGVLRLLEVFFPEAADAGRHGAADQLFLVDGRLAFSVQVFGIGLHGRDVGPAGALGAGIRLHLVRVADDVHAVQTGVVTDVGLGDDDAVGEAGRTSVFQDLEADALAFRHDRVLFFLGFLLGASAQCGDCEQNGGRDEANGFHESSFSLVMDKRTRSIPSY